MIRPVALLSVVAGLVSASAAQAQASEVGAAVETAVSACEQWLLKPATWAESVDAFPHRSGLDARGLRSQDSVPDNVLPSPQFRRAMHFWHVPVHTGGVFIVTSDEQPFCHAVGGGVDDYQPAAITAVESPELRARWTAKESQRSGDTKSTLYRSKEDANLSMIVSHAASAGQRTDRAQLIITMQFDVGN